MVRRYAHLAADHLAPYADRLCALRVVDAEENDTNTAQGGIGIGAVRIPDRAHRVAESSRPPPAPTERNVRISRITLFRS
jgi:hypothetical protein